MEEWNFRDYSVCGYVRGIGGEMVDMSRWNQLPEGLKSYLLAGCLTGQGDFRDLMESGKPSLTLPG